MAHRNFIVGIECKKLLEGAIAKQVPLTITNKKDDRWQIFRSKLLALQANRLVVSQPVSDTDGMTMDLIDGQEIAVTFKKGYHKCIFVSRVISRTKFESETGDQIEALTLLGPEQVEKISRRAYNRASPPPGENIPVRFCILDGKKSYVLGRKWEGILNDLSAGGVGLTVEKSQDLNLVEGEQFELWFVPLPGQEAMCLQARFRHASELPDSDKMVLGFQLMGLEMTEEGRHALRWIGRVVGVYQRQRPLSEHTELMPQIR